MARWVYIAATVLCTAGTVVCLGFSFFLPKQVGVGLSCDTTHVALGTLSQQQEVGVAFRLTNQSPDVIDITQLFPSCTCTDAEVGEKRLPPGASTTVRALVHTGNAHASIVSQIDVLYTVGSANALYRLPLVVTAEVTPHYSVTPDPVVFEIAESDRNSLPRIEIIVSSRMSPDVEVLAATSTHPAFEVSKPVLDPADGRNTAIVITFNSNNCIDPFPRGEIFLKTSSKLEPTHRVSARVVSKKN